MKHGPVYGVSTIFAVTALIVGLLAVVGVTLQAVQVVATAGAVAWWYTDGHGDRRTKRGRHAA